MRQRISYRRIVRISALAASILLAPTCRAPLEPSWRTADIVMTLYVPTAASSVATVPGGSAARLLDPATASVRVMLERSGASLAEETFARSDAASTMTITMEDVPVSTVPVVVNVSCLDSGGQILSAGSAELLLGASGSYPLSLSLAPTSLAGATIALGSIMSYAQDAGLSAAAGTSKLYRITATDAAADCAVSVGWTNGTAIFYAADGAMSARIAGSPEQWTIVPLGSATPAFVLFTAPASAAAAATLVVEKAVFVSPFGTGSGTRAAPLSGATLNTTYSSFSAPARFILAAGDYPGKFDLLNRMSVYGGFNSDFTTRDIAANKTNITGSFSTAATPDHILRVSGQAFVALDGVTVSPTGTTENGTQVDYSTIRVAGSGFRLSGCTVYSPSQELVFSFTAAGNIFSSLSISGQYAGMPIIVNGNSLVGGGTTWNLDSNSGGSTLASNILSISSSSAEVLVTGNVIDGGWDADIGVNGNNASETANGVYISGATPWVVGNTVASAGCDTIAGSLYNIRGVMGAQSLNGYVMNNFIFALDEYQATQAETDLIYMAGSTNRLNLLVWNYLTVPYQYLAFPGVNSLYDDTMGNVQSVAALNAVSTAAGAASNNSGNPVNSPTYSVYKAALDQIMVDFDGPLDDRSDYTKHDFRPRASAPPEILSGGLDLSVPGNIPAGFPAGLAPYLLYDRLGDPRAPGSWSMGAWQYAP
ncbi:MAG: hypothetical protein KKA67_14805 [Spirochaetes bacterium]|nr:hypothetical protein [Spirochaetota bacterium]MBU1079478.1 hypothetical protein [Spirochaetota bacterium]